MSHRHRPGQPTSNAEAPLGITSTGYSSPTAEGKIGSGQPVSAHLIHWRMYGAKPRSRIALTSPTVSAAANPSTTIFTIAKGQSPSVNPLIRHEITGFIVNQKFDSACGLIVERAREPQRRVAHCVAERAVDTRRR